MEHPNDATNNDGDQKPLEDTDIERFTVPEDGGSIDTVIRGVEVER